MSENPVYFYILFIYVSFDFTELIENENYKSRELKRDIIVK